MTLMNVIPWGFKIRYFNGKFTVLIALEHPVCRGFPELVSDELIESESERAPNLASESILFADVYTGKKAQKM